MIINTDLVIVPGKQDKYDVDGNKKIKVCEDYGLKTSKNQDEDIVVISDGCSMQNFSDLGSRILSYYYFKRILIDLRIFNDMQNLDMRKKEILDRSVYEMAKSKIKDIESSLISNFNIPNGDVLLSTISSLHVQGEFVFSNIINDGYLIIGWKNGTIEINKFSYAINAPYYLTYRYDIGRKNKYNETFKGNSVSWRNMKIDSGTLEVIEESFIKTRIDFNFFEKYSICDLKFILISTDGLETFHPLNEMDIIKDLIDFKSFRGEFIQRKINYIYKELKKDNIHNMDDLTIAGFSFEDE